MGISYNIFCLALLTEIDAAISAAWLRTKHTYVHILKGHLSTNSSFRVTDSSWKVCKSLLVVPFVWLLCLLAGTQIINCRLAVLLLKFANLSHWHNEDNAFGDKKITDFFPHKHLLRKQEDKGHHSTNVFKPLLICPKLIFRSSGRRIHAFRKTGWRIHDGVRRTFFSLSFSFHFPCQKGIQSVSQCFAGWSRMTRTDWD